MCNRFNPFVVSKKCCLESLDSYNNHIQQRYFICWYHILLILVLCAKYQNPHFSPKDNENDESDLIYFISIGWPNTQFRNLSVKWPKKYHFETKLVWVDLKSSKVRISSNLIIFYQYNIHNLESFFFLKFNRSLLWSTQTWFKINWNQTVQ